MLALPSVYNVPVKGEAIMKHLKKIICLVMVLTFVFTFASPISTADAATKSIKEGVWTNIKSTSNYYKVVVPGEGYVTLSAKNTKGGIAYFDFLNSKKQFFSDPETVYSTNGKVDNIKVPVSKGTYYIRLNDDSYFGLAGHAYAKYTFTSIKQGTNYCMAKALTLKSGSYKKIYQTPKYSFDRFFKIKLTTARKITVKSKSEVEIYDIEGNEISNTDDFDNNNMRIYKTKKLKAGTYYLQVQYMYYDVTSIYKVKWQ